MRFAVIDSNNAIVAFSPVQITYNLAKGSAAHPAPWRSLPCPEASPPAFDPATQALVGPSYAVGADQVTESYSVRSLTSQEIDDAKTAKIDALDLVAFQVLFNHENRIRTLEGKGAITAQQFITGVKALL